MTDRLKSILHFRRSSRTNLFFCRVQEEEEKETEQQEEDIYGGTTDDEQEETTNKGTFEEVTS